MVTALAVPIRAVRQDLHLLMRIAIMGSQLGHWPEHLDFQMRSLSLIAFPYDEQQSPLEYLEPF